MTFDVGDIFGEAVRQANTYVYDNFLTDEGRALWDASEVREKVDALRLDSYRAWIGISIDRFEDPDWQEGQVRKMEIAKAPVAEGRRQ